MLQGLSLNERRIKMSLVIQEFQLQFTRPIAKRRATNRIVVHHTAGHDNSVPEIHQMHLNRKWVGIGYHYIIRQNGNIERGRPEALRGAHAGDANVDSIGIGLTGNFERNAPTSVQITSLVALIRDIKRRLGQNIIIVRHSDVMNTLCPGRLFPWTELLERVLLREYVVQSGDTIWSIAATHLGNGARWVEIQRLNNISNNDIKIGQRLRLPQ